MPPAVSIIIPTLNEEKTIAQALDSLRPLSQRIELILVDGQSNDSTRSIAEKRLREFPNAILISSKRGRGVQLNAGARAASGNVLLFLHADTTLPPDALEQVEAALAEGAIGGNFRMVCGGHSFSSRLFTRLNSARRWFGIYYGDSVIWVTRAVFERLGGYLSAPLMEDYDFCRKLERAGRTACLKGPVVTSPRRWTRGRALYIITLWTLIQWLYLLGVSPHLLVRLYHPSKKRFRALENAHT